MPLPRKRCGPKQRLTPLPSRSWKPIGPPLLLRWVAGLPVAGPQGELAAGPQEEPAAGPQAALRAVQPGARAAVRDFPG